MAEDLFGNVIEKDLLLRDRFMEPPFSVLDTKQGTWRNRKRLWVAKGIKSEEGRGENVTFGKFGENEFNPYTSAKPNITQFDGYRETEKKKGMAQCLPTSIDEKYGRKAQGTSIFDPVLCELSYRWFCPDGGSVLDVFAGGSVRGIVANYLGYRYTGIDLRPEQIYENRKQAEEIMGDKPHPTWIIGDSNSVLNTIFEQYDMLFTCPPYMDLEVYSELEDDISNMPDDEFEAIYRSILRKSALRLKDNSFAVIVVGEVRNPKGFYKNFVEMTKDAYVSAGLNFYNDMVLLNSVGTASIRASNSMRNRKVVKIHQNVLVFYKGDPKQIQDRFPTI